MAAAGFAQVVRADTEAESEEDTRRAPLFTLDHLDSYVEFETQFDQTRVRSKQARNFRRRQSQTNRDWTLEERVGFNLAGTVVDPSFLTFAGDFSFALTQAHYMERSQYQDITDDDSGYLLLYDLRANFFTGKRLSGSVYASRRDDRINRRFQPSLNERRTEFGTSWTFADDHFPMELSYDYRETDRTNNNDRRDNEHFIDSVLRYSADWIISDFHKFHFSLEHGELKQEYQGLSQGFDTTRDLFTLEHDLRFGDDHQHSFQTLVHWQEESGDFARDFFEIGPQLTLQHTDNLQTLYKYQFNRERYEGLDVETQRADFQLVHQLYSNLTSTFDIFGLHEDVEDDVNITQYGALADWQYNRSNPYGHFYANLSIGYDTEDASGDNGVRLVLNESAVLRDPLNVRLRNPNVVGGSIVVTDATNRRFFYQGIDYAVLQFGEVTYLFRMPTGRILDGDSVLIDYQYRTPSDGKIDTTRVDFSIEQQFTSGWTPYYRLSYRNQEAAASRGFARFGEPRYADRTDHHRIGVRYEHEKFTVGCEYEIFDDTIEPYDAFHIDGVYHIIKTPDHTLDASSRFGRYFFEGGLDRRNVTQFDAELDHRWRLAENLSTFQRVHFRYQDDALAGLTRGWDVTAGFDYVIGLLTAQLSFEYDRLRLPLSEEDEFGVYLRLRRDIPNVLAQR